MVSPGDLELFVERNDKVLVLVSRVQFACNRDLGVARVFGGLLGRGRQILLRVFGRLLFTSRDEVIARGLS